MNVINIPLNNQYLSGGGEMGTLIRRKDWSNTPVGKPENWPQSLHSTLELLLHSKFPMFLWWGPELICFYNDAYRFSLGENGKHPAILGLPAQEAWPEIWDIIKPLINQVLEGGEAIWQEDQLIPIYRNGKIEDVYWTFSYSPVGNGSGNVAGVLVTCSETTGKMITQKKLEENKDQLQFAIDAADLATWDLDIASNRFTGNDRLKQWHGLPPELAFDLTAGINQVAEKDREDLKKAIQHALQFSSGGILDHEYSIVNPVTRQIRIVRAKGRVTFSEDKTATRLNGILIDVTLEVLSRKKIEESEERFRTMAEGTAVLIAVGDEAGNATYFNKAWVELTGRPMQYLLQFGWAGLVHTEDRESHVSTYLAAFEKRGPFTGEFRILNNKGAYRWLLVNGLPRFRADGSFAGYISSCVDITERKQAEKALKQSEERFQAAIAAVHGILWTNNAKGEMEGHQPGWESLTGQSYADYQGYGWATAVHPEDAQPTIEAWNRAVAEHNTFVFEHRLLQKNGKWGIFSVRAIPLLNADGPIREWVGVHTDITSLRLSEASLKESEERFRTMANSAPVLIWMTGTDKRCNFFNTEWLRFTGRSLEQELGNGWLEGLHADDCQKCLDIYNAAFDRREEFYIEYRLKRYDGEYRWISVKGVPRSTPNGIFEGYIGACMDIHERVIYQKKLKDDEEKLNIIIDASELGTWELNLITKEINYSNRYLQILGYGPNLHLEYSTLLKRLHPDDLAIREKAFKQAYANGILQYETRTVWNDQSIHWIEARGKVFFDEDRMPVKIVGTLRDITHEKNYRQQLQEREQKFRLLADSMPQHIWTADPQGNLNYYNQSVFNYSGLTNEQISKDGWLQIVHPDDREENARLWMEAVKTGNGFLFEHRFRRHDGEYRWQLSRAIPQKDGAGHITMWVGTSTDIQEQKIFTHELEKQVEERTRELEQKNKELEIMNAELQSFAYISSHDLQEPLRKIQTFASRIVQKEEINLSEYGKDYLRRMQEAAKRMQTLIEDLLTYSRTNTTDRHFQNTDLNIIFEQVKDELKDDIHQAKAIVEAASLCEARIIPFQFRQLLHNLISNALKFSKPGITPHIKFNSEMVEGSRLNISPVSPHSLYCHLSVSDNGIGFDPQYKHRIFEVFQRLHGKDEYKGTGIGLAIVKKIVENHNGIITANSTPGNGATFDIYFPVS